MRELPGLSPVAEMGNSHITRIITNLALAGVTIEQGVAESPGKSRRIGYILWLAYMGF